MISMLPLILLWLASNQRRQALPSHTNAPRWPTPASPPPMPAFQPADVPMSADPSHSSTPLAALHNQPPELAPAHAATEAAAAKTAVLRAARAKASQALRSKAANLFAPSATDVTVAKLQDILNARGVKIKRDGLYGPQTASAWAKLATSKRLPSAIARKGPKIAKVSTHTLDALSVPAIP